MVPLDMAVIIAGKAFDALGERVKAVEKLFLVYALSQLTLLSSPSQLDEFVRRAAGQLREGEDRLRYHHAFEDGSTDEYQFFVDHKAVLKDMMNVYIKVTP